MGCSLFLQLKSKVEKSTMELFKLNSLWKPSERDDDIEILTNEEKECLRRIGQKMNSSLVLGMSHWIHSWLLI